MSKGGQIESDEGWREVKNLMTVEKSGQVEDYD